MTTASKIFLHRKRVCDFCGKGEDAVSVLIVSPGEKADICDECVAVCVEVIADSAAKKKAKAESEDPSPKLPAWKQILADVSGNYGVPIEVILGPLQTKRVTPARYEAAYRMVNELGMGLTETGRCLNRDRTTIIYGMSRHIAAHPELQPKSVAA